ncbi:MAG: isochorismate synthase [Actinomycetota bacterium]
MRSLRSVTRELPAGTDPLDGLAAGSFVWSHEGTALVGTGVAARVAVATGPGRLEKAAGEVATLLGAIEVDDPLGLAGTGPLAVGALAFHDGQESELIVPARVVGRDADGRAWVTEVGPAPASARGAVVGPARGATPTQVRGATPGRPPGLEPTSFAVESAGGRMAWTAGVRGALDAIAAGRIEKVVLARRVTVWGDQPFAAAAVVDRLRRSHPSCFTFATPAGFVGASPELLLRRRGRWAWSRPMAGTVERGGGRAEDRRRESALRSSPKERDEHRLVVEDVKARLERACPEVFVKRPEVVALSSVTHLATSVTARLGTPAPTALDLVALLHPTPAVGGAPREAALAALAALEPFDRGLYAGPVGWVDRRGDGDWAVALRCAQLDGRRATLWAGAGIVTGSSPEAEWAETQAKLEPMLRALVRV